MDYYDSCKTSCPEDEKSFGRPHNDYGDVIYDQSYNNTFHQKMESVQYNGAIAITGAIRGSSREKLYQELELGLKPLQQRQWYSKLCYFFELTKKGNLPSISSIMSPPLQTLTIFFNSMLGILFSEIHTSHLL